MTGRWRGGRWPFLLLGCWAAHCAGCAGARTGASDSGAGTVDARALASAAAEAMASDPAGAERLAREAVRADSYCGEAHNNLGAALLRRADLAGAAEHFERARLLLPGHPDPRLNLALVYERAGRAPDAVEAARAALEARPGYVPALQVLARLLVAEREVTDELAGALREIALRGETEAWRAWARRELPALDGRGDGAPGTGGFRSRP